MPLDAFKNFAKVLVSTGYDDVTTSIVLATGEAAKLPAAPFNVVWWNAGAYNDPSDDPNREIVRVTAIVSDTLTVTRAQEGTAATTKNTGNTYKMIAGITAKTLNTDLNNFNSVYEPFPFVNTSALTFNGASISHAVQFIVREPVSVSFVRLPALMTTNSTTYGTTGASLSASVQIRSTFNVVAYTPGTGASSRSMMSYTSGAGFWTLQNSISVAANGTQYSISKHYSYNVEGNTTSTSSGYSISNTNYSWVSTGFDSLFTTNRWIDVPMAASFSPGNYWLVVGMSTSSLTNSTGISLASQGNFRYSAHYGMSQANMQFGIMGSTNLTSGGALMGGSFSTAGGGTTSAFPVSAISSWASQPRPYFQMLRSA